MEGFRLVVSGEGVADPGEEKKSGEEIDGEVLEVEENEWRRVETLLCRE